VRYKRYHRPERTGLKKQTDTCSLIAGLQDLDLEKGTCGLRIVRLEKHMCSLFELCLSMAVVRIRGAYMCCVRERALVGELLRAAGARGALSPYKLHTASRTRSSHPGPIRPAVPRSIPY
jgi:hypothetical protein